MSSGRFPRLKPRVHVTRKDAELEIPGHEGRVPAGRLVSVGKVLDPAIANPARSRSPSTTAHSGLPVGQSAFLYLLMETTQPRPVVPAAAIVDDAGRPIVFVQREGKRSSAGP